MKAQQLWTTLDNVSTLGPDLLPSQVKFYTAGIATSRKLIRKMIILSLFYRFLLPYLLFAVIFFFLFSIILTEVGGTSISNGERVN